jgi:hypothetical protein
MIGFHRWIGEEMSEPTSYYLEVMKKMVTQFKGMTQQEHNLMVLMFARQACLIKVLVDILKSRNILDDSDVEAFSLFAHQDEAMELEMVRRVGQFYQEVATRTGAAAPSVNL